MSRTSRELVAKFFNMLKNFMRIFSPKYFARLSRDSRATVARRSCECRELVAAKFWRIYNAKFSRHSYECRASVARRSRDSLAKTSRLPGEKIKLSDIRTTVARHSRDIVSKLDRNSRICRKNVYSMRLQRESCVYIVYLCREIVANYSRTSLQLSHSSEIGALRQNGSIFLCFSPWLYFLILILNIIIFSII